MIVDFRFTPPMPEGLGRYNNPADYMAGYARTFGTRVFKNDSNQPMPAEDLLQWMDQVGVDKVLLKSADSQSTLGKKFPMEKLRDYVKGHEDRLVPLAGVDPHKGMAAVRELEIAVKEWGFKGLNMGPYEHKIRANDKLYYPIYTKAAELGIPVLLHTSVNFSVDLPLDVGRPIHLDEVARHFPELKLVAVHGGWPWVEEMIAVAWRHPNVYIEISGTRPKYIGMEHSGWDSLLIYGNGILQNKIVWGSNWPMGTWEEGIEGVKNFPLKEEVKKKWLGLNACKIFGWDVPAQAAASAK